MVLENAWQIEQTWGSNQPVLKGVMEILKPKTVVECGCGKFSTPILRNCDKLITIEHDKKWAKMIQKIYPPSAKHEYFTHGIPNTKNGTDMLDVPVELLQTVTGFYIELSDKIGPIDFLLIDTYRCARVIAAQELSLNASMVMLHDVRPKSRKYYRYHQLDEIFEGWHHYQLKPTGRINKKHIIAWSSLYSKYAISLKNINQVVGLDSKRLWNQSVGLEEVNGA